MPLSDGAKSRIITAAKNWVGNEDNVHYEVGRLDGIADFLRSLYMAAGLPAPKVY